MGKITHTQVSSLAHRDPPAETFDRLEVTSELKRKYLRILNIGVGEGYCTHYLSGQGHTVDVLDISETALKKVEQITSNQFANPNLLPKNEYDLALSHLVAQHMNNEDLTTQISLVLQSLKADGILALQYVGHITDNKYSSQPVTEEMMKKGTVIRSAELMKNIVNQANGQIKQTYLKEQYAQHSFQYYVVHIAPQFSPIV